MGRRSYKPHRHVSVANLKTIRPKGSGMRVTDLKSRQSKAYLEKETAAELMSEAAGSDPPPHEHLPTTRTSGRLEGYSSRDQVLLEGGTQSFLGGKQDEHSVESDEEPVPRKTTAPLREARQRQGSPKFQSKLAKRLAAVPGGAGSNHAARGFVRSNRAGRLEYWSQVQRAWISAVYHVEIRQKLIDLSETDVYSCPRDGGPRDTDVTSFLASQKYWDLERDHGWANITNDVLFIFTPLDIAIPTYKVSWLYNDGLVVLDVDNHPIKDYKDIPLTLSSRVEGALVEAIRRLDPRITIPDIAARLPRRPEDRGTYVPNSLNDRMARFRFENACPAWRSRKGVDALRQYVWDRMSPAARLANSTRELSKLSKAEQREARKPNRGKHTVNAAGWARPPNPKVTESLDQGVGPSSSYSGIGPSSGMEGALQSEPVLPATGEGVFQPWQDPSESAWVSISPQGLVYPYPQEIVPGAWSTYGMIGSETPWTSLPPVSVDQRDHSRETEDEIFGISRGLPHAFADAIDPALMLPPGHIDFGDIRPWNQEDMQNANPLQSPYRLRLLTNDETQRPLIQSEGATEQFCQDSSSLPAPATSFEPWSEGFNDWVALTGENEEFVDWNTPFKNDWGLESQGPEVAGGYDFNFDQDE